MTITTNKILNGYPLQGREAYVDAAQTEAYLDMLFGAVRFNPDHWVIVRAIGEKGTPQEGTRHDEHPYQMLDEDYLNRAVTQFGPLLAPWDIAAYISPVIFRDHKGSAEHVELMTCLLIDLDSGDTDAKLAHLETHIGPASMIVASGGVTADGQLKRHAYWSFSEPNGNIADVINARHELAVKGGGDRSFGRAENGINQYGRAHQVVRMPGTCHAKNGKPSMCRILNDTGLRYDFYELSAMLRSMPFFDGAQEPTQAMGSLSSPSSFNFDLNHTHQKPPIEDTLHDEIHEGGEDKTRWSEFSRVAGWEIHLVRSGSFPIEQARENALNWMTAKMVPPWPMPRFETEWNNLVAFDTRKQGPLPVRTSLLTPVTKDAAQTTDPDLGLYSIAYHRWRKAEKPQRRFLVNGIVQEGKHHLMVAEGGAGKTQLLLALAMMVAAPRQGDAWLGGALNVREAAPVIIITTEDDQEELDIRLHDLDKHLGGRIEQAGDNLMILSTIDHGGSFTLASRDSKGNIDISARWAEMLALIKLLKVPPRLVVIDTLNTTLHGEENSATVINEYIRYATRICGETGAALIVTHHMGKRSEPIRNAEEMREAIRGSSAIVSSFRINIGIWQAPDWSRRMKAMGLAPKKNMLWQAAILKANNPELFEDTRTLLRSPVGLLEDCTHLDTYAHDNRLEELAWLEYAIREAARQGYPYTTAGKNSPTGLFMRRNELHPILARAGWRELDRKREALMESGRVVLCAAKGGTDRKFLDAQGGPFASDEAGAEIAKGSYSALAPDWSRWRYDSQWNQVMPE